MRQIWLPLRLPVLLPVLLTLPPLLLLPQPQPQLLTARARAPPPPPPPRPCRCSYDEPIINEGAIKALKSLFSFGKKDDDL